MQPSTRSRERFDVKTGFTQRAFVCARGSRYFLPLVLGFIIVASVDPVGLFYGFGLFAIATGDVYRSPIPVQPMKAAVARDIEGPASYDVLITTVILFGLTLIILKWLALFRAMSFLVVKIRSRDFKKMKPAPGGCFHKTFPHLINSWVHYPRLFGMIGY